MAKAGSPLRIQASLMEAAIISGRLMHRSAAEQVEYWADLGRKVADAVTPEHLLAIQAGLAQLRVEQCTAKPVDPEAVFAALERDRQADALTAPPTTIRYQASRSSRGLLEQCHPDGRIITGHFKNGQFLPTNPE